MRLQVLLTTGFILSMVLAKGAFAEPVPVRLTELAAAPLSLRDVQSAVLKKNRDVQVAVLEVSKTEAALHAAKASRLPGLLALGFAGQQVNSGYGQNLALLPGVFEPVTQQYRLSLQVHQATLDVQIARQKLRLAKQNAISDVKKAYLHMVALASAIASRELILSSLRALEAYVAAEVKRGSALKVDLLMVQAKRARAEYELDRDKDEYITFGQTLNRLLDRPIKTAVEVIDEPFVAPPEVESESAIAEAKAKRPEVSALRMSATRSNLEQKVQVSRYIPDVSFGATGVFSQYLSPTLPKTFVTVGFLGVWQPWDWGRRLDIGKMAERQRRQRLVELDDLSDKVAIEADNARRALSVVAEEVNAAGLAQTSTQEDLRITERRYKVGAAVIKDVAQAQAAYSAAISENVKAKSDFVNAQVEFERVLGKDFD